MSLADTFKTAAGSVFGVAKTFTKNFNESLNSADATPVNRAADQTDQADQADQADRGPGLVDRAAGLINSARTAVEKTAQDDTFAEAKEELSKAFQATREEITERVNDLRQKVDQGVDDGAGAGAGANAGAGAGAGAGADADAGADKVEGNIVDGEVISVDGQKPHTTE